MRNWWVTRDPDCDDAGMVEHAVENGWWIAQWGDPCRECGFDWSQSPATAIAAVEALPDQFDSLLAGRTGDEQAAGATWSARAYVFHVADNLRIFAERLEGVFAGAPTTLAAYDQDELAAARDYEAMSVQSALWSVRTATETWAAAAHASLTPRRYLPARGTGRAQRGRDHAGSRARRGAPPARRQARAAAVTESTRRVSSSSVL